MGFVQIWRAVVFGIWSGVLALPVLAGSAVTEPGSADPKPPTPATLAVLAGAEASLPIGDFSDGTLVADYSTLTLVAELPERLRIPMFPGAQRGRPPAMHPSTWGRLTSVPPGGLYQLADGVYQIHGDLARITLVRGETGWIVLDAGTTTEFARAGWRLAQKHLPGGADVPISTVIYSHSHSDHFGGVAGLITQADVDAGKVQVIAPFGFMNEVVSESVLAGAAMGRRAEYHFGRLLRAGTIGRAGSYSLIPPTEELPFGPGAVTVREVDGVTFHFKDVSGAEAPAATLMYLPKYKMIFNSEMMFRGLHNIYTLRGAKVRDALFWSKMINEVIATWGHEVERMSGPHGPEFSGNARILEYMRVQRDNYGFLHNQTLRLLNRGVPMQDMGQMIEEMVPRSLSQLWHTHGYHGTYSHNARAVVNRYLGFYDGNPANLNPLQTLPEAQKFVEYMGGADQVLARAAVDFESGEYRFVATALNKVVTADPDNKPAVLLLADTYEQLGYQAEGPQWRNAYFSAALELRAGKVLGSGDPRGSTRSSLVGATTLEQMLDALAIRVNGPRADGHELSFNLVVPDVGETFYLELAHSNLSAVRVAAAREAQATLTIRKTDLPAVLSAQRTAAELVAAGQISVEGDGSVLATLLSLLDVPDARFELVPLPD